MATHLCGPFLVNPCSLLSLFPPFRSPGADPVNYESCVDLSHPQGFSVNSGIPKDTYLNEPFSLRFPGTDTLQIIICEKALVATFLKRTSAMPTDNYTLTPVTTVTLGSVTTACSTRHSPSFRPPFSHHDVPEHHVCCHFHVQVSQL